MLSSIKNKTQRTTLISLLQFIVAGTQSAAGYAFVPEDEAKKLLKAEPTFLTLDETVKNEGGQIKAVASQIAIDALTASAAGETEAGESGATDALPAAPGVTSYELGEGELPDIQRGGIKSDSYPFATLGAPKPPATPEGKVTYAFFTVPATTDNPNPAKRLASTVASATKRYKDTDKREFAVRKLVDADKKVLGARVFRIK